MTSQQKLLVSLIAVIFSAKLILALTLINVDREFFTHDDGVGYTYYAESLSSTGEFVIEGQGNSTRRLPFFPAFLSLSYHFGDAAQMYVYAATALLIFHSWLLWIATMLIRNHGVLSGLAFVGFMSTSMLWLHYTVATHTDFLFSIMLMSAFLLMDRFLQSDERSFRSRNFQIAIALYALCFITRPDLLIFPVFFIGYGVLINRPARLKPYCDNLLSRFSVVFILSGYVLVIAWSLRNWAVGLGFHYTSQTTELLPRYVHRLAEHDPKYLDVNVKQFDTAEMISFIQQTGLEFIYVSAKGMLLLFFSIGRWFLHRYMEALDLGDQIVKEGLAGFAILNLPPVELLYVGFRIFFLMALYLSFVAFFARNRDMRLWISFFVLMAPVFYLVLMQVYWGAGMRFTIPVIPFIAYFAALTFSSVHRSRQVPAEQI